MGLTSQSYKKLTEDLLHIMISKTNGKGKFIFRQAQLFHDGILLLTKTSVPKLDNIKIDPKGKYIIFRVANTSDVVVALYHLQVFWKINKS